MKKEKTPVLLTPSSGVLCKTCKHYRDATEVGDEEAAGECLRYPPTPMIDGEGDMFSAFPVVLAQEHCGEHSPVLS